MVLKKQSYGVRIGKIRGFHREPLNMGRYDGYGLEEKSKYYSKSLTKKEGLSTFYGNPFSSSVSYLVELFAQRPNI